MRVLITEEIKNVSGGNFQLHVTAQVPEKIKDWVGTMVSNIQNGTIKDPYTFVLYLNQANHLGIDFSAISINSIAYEGINP